MTSRVDELLHIANAISRGEIPAYQHNECYTSGAFDLLLVEANGGEAFEMLETLCRRFESVKASGNGMKGYYELVTLLARQSNTTEVPSGMHAVISEQPELSSGLRSWYRDAG
ncbi:hypothetical protein ISP17_05110 [Dyella ginsengisoli]|uniref:Uncharacterized protein n=1 Tax=Dyella ginsengisoli TaxID=363848 RepID=A0ABW8JQF2_9GAMM